MKEVTVSSLAHIDEVDNLINGGLPLVLKAAQLYFRPVVLKHQKISSYLDGFSFYGATDWSQYFHMLGKFYTIELHFSMR